MSGSRSRAPTTVEIPGLEDALRAVVAGAPRRSIEAQNGDVAYLVQVLPYRAPDGHHIGAIVTLTDVSELVELRQTAGPRSSGSRASPTCSPSRRPSMR